MFLGQSKFFFFFSFFKRRAVFHKFFIKTKPQTCFFHGDKPETLLSGRGVQFSVRRTTLAYLGTSNVVRGMELSIACLTSFHCCGGVIT